MSNTTDIQRVFRYGKRIIEFLPLFTSILIFLGFLDLTLYYDKFGISIYHYITITEILTLFLPTIRVSVFILLYAVGIISSNRYFVHTTQGKGIDEFRNIIDCIKDEWNYGDYRMLLLTIVQLVFYLFKPFLGVFGVYWIYQSIFHYVEKDEKFYYSLGLLLFQFFLGLYFLYLNLIYYLKPNAFKYVQKIFISWSMFFFAFIFILSTINNRNASFILNKHKNNVKVKAVFKDSTVLLTNDSSIFYIGQTQNFLFFREQLSKSTSIYNKVELKKIQFWVETDLSKSILNEHQ